MAKKKTSKPVRRKPVTRPRPEAEARRMYFLPGHLDIRDAEAMARWRRLKAILDGLSDDDADFVVREIDRIAREVAVHGLEPFKPDIKSGVEGRRNRSLGPKKKQARDAEARDALDAAVLAQFSPKRGVKALEIPKPLVKGKGAGNWKPAAIYLSLARLKARGLLPGK